MLLWRGFKCQLPLTKESSKTSLFPREYLCILSRGSREGEGEDESWPPLEFYKTKGYITRMHAGKLHINSAFVCTDCCAVQLEQQQDKRGELNHCVQPLDFGLQSFTQQPGHVNHTTRDSSRHTTLQNHWWERCLNCAQNNGHLFTCFSSKFFTCFVSEWMNPPPFLPGRQSLYLSS